MSNFIFTLAGFLLAKFFFFELVTLISLLGSWAFFEDLLFYKYKELPKKFLSSVAMSLAIFLQYLLLNQLTLFKGQVLALDCVLCVAILFYLARPSTFKLILIELLLLLNNVIIDFVGAVLFYQLTYLSFLSLFTLVSFIYNIYGYYIFLHPIKDNKKMKLDRGVV